MQDPENPELVIARNEKLRQAKGQVQNRLDADEKAIKRYEANLKEVAEYKTCLEFFEITPFFSWQTPPIDEPFPLPNPIKPLILPLSQAELETMEQDFEPVVPPNNILLNSWKIRRAGWENLANEKARPFNYKLSSNADSSETKTPPLASMTDQVLAEEIFMYTRDWDSVAAKVPAGRSALRLCDLAASKMQCAVELEDDLRHPPRYNQQW